MEEKTKKFEIKCKKCGVTIHFNRQCDYNREKNNRCLCKKCKNEIRKNSNLKIRLKKCIGCGIEFKSVCCRKCCDECFDKIKSGKFKLDVNGLKPKMSREEYNEKRRTGEIANLMQGRSVYSVWVEKYGRDKADVLKEQMSTKMKKRIASHTEEEKKRINEKKGNKGTKNGMYGKTIYEVWVEKYGKEEADKKWQELKRKKSEKSKGKNNPMYGKPAPIGSGNGLSGWYKGWYFRSLRELSYMVNVIEKEDHKWISLDNTKDFRIKYLALNGNERSYCPDFLIDDRMIVEIKPKELHLLDGVTRKENAAILFCKTRGLTYTKIDPEMMDFSIVEKMLNGGEIKFTEISLTKFLKYQNKVKRRIE